MKMSNWTEIKQPPYQKETALFNINSQVRKKSKIFVQNLLPKICENFF